MSGIVLLVVAVIIVVAAYYTYGNYVANKLNMSNENQTPAHTQSDGVDYVPARAPVLLGHHFASIAGAGPIVGPIIALAFGWGPVYLWILIGVIFIGAVHDFTSLIVSIRNDGKSIGEIIEHNIGKLGKRLFLAFSWSALILVIAVFLDVVAKTFTHNPAVATASILFILLAVVFGLGLYKLKLSLGVLTVIGVFFLFLCMVAGINFPIAASENTWIIILLGYIFLASTLPVWILLQPRDYLNSFLLYALMTGALIGVFFFKPELQINAFTGFYHPQLGSLFPILFITVACGAISGFHSLVASGTTAKQLNHEKDAKVIGFGGMLMEGVLAIVALIAAASLGGMEFDGLFSEGKYIDIFAAGVSRFIASLPFLDISESAGKTFTAMAVSAFALTSLDTATRLSRFAFQEFFESGEKNTSRWIKLFQNRFAATFMTVSIGAILLFSGGAIQIWPVFGSANQLLAAIALLAVTVWLSKRKNSSWFTQIPMVFMFVITIAALLMIIYNNLILQLNIILALIALLLLILSFVLVYKSYRQLTK